MAMKDSHRVPGQPLRRIDLEAMKRQDRAKAHFFDVGSTEIKTKEVTNWRESSKGDASASSRQE